MVYHLSCRFLFAEITRIEEVFMVDVKGKWAFITGAARGIGYLSALFMADQGCNLILHSRSLAHTEKVLNEVKEKGVEAYAAAAAETHDPRLRSMYTELAEDERRHGNALWSLLKNQL